MASLIKKQILKHLSKFTKNLSADSINLSTFKGEGELSNLEFDCVAIQNLINLPTWLQINRATCNRVAVKIPWTKLKSTPISMSFDAIEVEMVTCEKPREPNGPSPIQASGSSGDTSYGYTVKVLEGMTVNVNSISVNFISAAFNANFQLSQLLVMSTDPNLNKTDLRMTRITDKSLGQVLTFKTLSWQTMRIVADAVKTNDKASITPLRLITNQTKVMMTFRRRTSDCTMLASKLHIQFDDLLWVLTDSQVQSLLLCVKSLRDTIERSNQQMRELGLDKSHETHQVATKAPSTQHGPEDGTSSKYFSQYSLVESSIHIDLNRVDLHICEESSPIHRASSKRSLEGGAIQIILHNLKLDHYPDHKANFTREHFRDYGETMKERNTWSEGIIDQFRRDFVELRRAASAAGNLHQPTATNKKQSRLVESCLSVRLGDIDVHQVTTSNSKKSCTGKLLSSTRKELHLPEEMPMFHFIRTEYYYPDGRDYPAPSDNIFMQLNAPQFHAHWDSLHWINCLTLTTLQAVQKMLEDLGILQQEEDDADMNNLKATKEEEHADIRIQILMPKIFIPGPPSTHREQPHGLELQVSQAVVTNCRDGTDCTCGHLKQVLKKMEQQHFARNPETFPGNKEIDLPHLSEKLWREARGDDKALNMSVQSGNPTLGLSALKSPAAHDIWCASVEQIWIDFIMPIKEKPQKSPETNMGGFLNAKSNFVDISNGHHLPFLDSFPVSLWIAKSIGVDGTSSKLASPDRKICGSTSEDLLLTSKLNEKLKERKNKQSDDTSQSGDEMLMNSTNHSMRKSEEPDRQHTGASSPISSITSPTSPEDEFSRSGRNHRLLDFYRANVEESKDVKSLDSVSLESRDQSFISSTSYSKKSTSTYILVNTDKHIALQVDHHQYLFLLHLIDMVEDVGQKLEFDTEDILRSPISSQFSTPSHSSVNINSAFQHNRDSKKQNHAKPVNTTSVRLSAPSADLFLILRPSPLDIPDEELEISVSTAVIKTPDSVSVASSAKSEPDKEEFVSNLFKNLGDDSKVNSAPQTLLQKSYFTPELSECGSDTLSMFEDTSSAVGDELYSGHVGGMYPHSADIPSSDISSGVSSGVYPHDSSGSELSVDLCDETTLLKKSLAEELPAKATSVCPVPGEPSMSKQKSGSFSVSDSSAAVHYSKLKASERLQARFRNYSSDNLTISSSAGSGQVLFSKKSEDLSFTPKSGSSGYESGSLEHSPLSSTMKVHPNVDKLSSSSQSSRSGSASDISDQFVVIQVDEHGKGVDNMLDIREKKKTSSADSPGLPSETSSISSGHVQSNGDSLMDLADSQITVTDETLGKDLSVSDCEQRVEMQKEEIEQEVKAVKKKKSMPEMSTLLQIHVSKNVELAIDSNDDEDSVVKLIAMAVDLAELGFIETEKISSVFVKYGSKFPKGPESTLEVNKNAPQVCLRLDSGPLAERHSPASVKAGCIQISADNVPMSLKTSTLMNLGAFIEDEVVAEVVPMRILAKDVTLNIEDDLPAAYENTPKAPPITLSVHSATVLRSDDGTFHVTTSSSGNLLNSFLPPPPYKELPGSTSPSSVEVKSEIPSKGDADTDAELAVTAEDMRNSTENNASMLLNGDVCSSMHDKPTAIVTAVVNGTAEKPNSTKPRSVFEDNIKLRERLEATEAERDSLVSALKQMQDDLFRLENERSVFKSQLKKRMDEY